MIKEISTVEEFNDLISQGAIPVDVRSEGEYTSGKIPNIKVGYDWNGGEFVNKIEDFNPENTYIMVCRSGGRSMQACMALSNKGFENLYNLQGGMLSWSGEVE